MSEESKKNQHFETLFQKLQQLELTPSKDLITPVLVRLKKVPLEKQRLSIRFWQLFSGLAVATVFGLIVYTNFLFQQIRQDGLTSQAYVIQIDFNQNDIMNVAQAEIILPTGVNFVNSQGQALKQTSLKLPLSVKQTGRGRLPFVVSSDRQGQQTLTVRLLNSKNELVREQNLNFKFAKANQHIAF